MPKVIVRKHELPSVVGFSIGTARRLMNQGKFPRPRQLSEGGIGWPVAELEEWARNLPVATTGSGMRGEETRLRKKREAAAKEAA
jgi:predicted DNA-binding transcriptional regulator AlpA